MEKTSKVTKCEFKNTWEGPKGTVHYHVVEFENGDIGNIGTKEKKPDKLAVGTEHTYDLEATDKGNRIKIISQNKFGGSNGGGGSKYKPEPYEQKIAGFALSYAKDLCVADKIGLADIITNAEIYYKWLLNKKV